METNEVMNTVEVMDTVETEEAYIVDAAQYEVVSYEDKTQSDDYETRPFECPVCDKKFNRSAHVKIHMASHSEVRPYACELCGDKFKQNSSLKVHMLIHSGERPYTCQVCYRSFRINSTLKKHLLLHTGEKPHTCEVCGKTFTQKSGLKSHSYTHKPESERPIHCSLCNRGFLNRSNFKAHVNSCNGEHKKTRKRSSNLPSLNENLLYQNGVKKYECSFCKKLFPSKPRLRIHLRTHTGERPYKCEVCSMAFKQSGDLKVHSYIHTGERPHKCTMCGKGYTNRGTLNQHLRSHQKRTEAQNKGSMRTGSKNKKSASKIKIKLSSARKLICNKNLNVNSTNKTDDAAREFSNLKKKSDMTSDSEVSLSEESDSEVSLSKESDSEVSQNNELDSELSASEESDTEVPLKEELDSEIQIKNEYISDFEEEYNTEVAPDIEERKKGSLNVDINTNAVGKIAGTASGDSDLKNKNALSAAQHPGEPPEDPSFQWERLRLDPPTNFPPVSVGQIQCLATGLLERLPTLTGRDHHEATFVLAVTSEYPNMNDQMKNIVYQRLNLLFTAAHQDWMRAIAASYATAATGEEFSPGLGSPKTT